MRIIKNKQGSKVVTHQVTLLERHVRLNAMHNVTFTYTSQVMGDCYDEG